MEQLAAMQQVLDSINRRGRDAMRRYDNAPDGSDAKFRAQQDLADIAKERVEQEQKIERVVDEMVL
jgi:hypothetical protein